MSRKSIIPLLLLLIPFVLGVAVFLPGCGGGSGGGGSTSTPPTPTSTYYPTSGTPTTTITTVYPTALPTPALAEWTIMVYLCSDNDLDEYSTLNINQMELIGSDNNVNIIVQWDRPGGSGTDNWKGCRRYYITRDTSTGDTVNSTLVASLGDVNSGSPDTLREFGIWGITQFPAKKYAIVLWDHGNGWKYLKAREELRKSICWDDTSNDKLTQEELRQVMPQILSQTGLQKFELIGMDACLMGTVEVAYDLRNYGNYMTFSEASEPGAGWTYHTFLGDLQQNPTMNGELLGEYIVRGYSIASASTSSITLSTVDLSKMTDLALALNDFAFTASAKLGTETQEIKQSITDTQSLDYSYNDYKDLGDFCDQINKNVQDTQLKEKAAALKAALAQAVTYEYHGNTFPRAQGLTVWLPSDIKYDIYNSAYQSLLIAADTLWDNFLADLRERSN